MSSTPRSQRAGIDPARVDDVYLGVGNQWNTQSYNLGAPDRAATRCCRDAVGGFTFDRKCSIGADCARARGARDHRRRHRRRGGGRGRDRSRSPSTSMRRRFATAPKSVIAAEPHAYMAMIETAEIVADRYNVSREAQDAFAATSQQRAGAAQAAGALPTRSCRSPCTRRCSTRKATRRARKR